MPRFFAAFFVLALNLSAMDAFADEAQRMALAREVLAGGGTRFEQLFAQMVEPTVAKLAQNDPEKAADYDRTMRKIFAETSEQLINELAPMIVNEFTEQELTQIRDYQRSALAKKWAQFASPANKEFIAIVQKHTQRLMMLMMMSNAGPK
jgi:hypothetical protein